MSKSKKPQWVKDYYSKPAKAPTTGARECNECMAPAYSRHASYCPKAD